MVIGGRADATVVRTDSDAALVEGVFALKGPEKEAVNAVLHHICRRSRRRNLTRRSAKGNVARVRRTVGVTLL
jgi:DNA repair ATPase RecN